MSKNTLTVNDIQGFATRNPVFNAGSIMNLRVSPSLPAEANAGDVLTFDGTNLILGGSGAVTSSLDITVVGDNEEIYSVITNGNLTRIATVVTLELTFMYNSTIDEPSGAAYLLGTINNASFRPAETATLRAFLVNLVDVSTFDVTINTDGTITADFSDSETAPTVGAVYFLVIRTSYTGAEV